VRRPKVLAMSRYVETDGRLSPVASWFAIASISAALWAAIALLVMRYF
jgi:hypothetical protein